LDDTEYEALLYDFRLHPLDLDQYQTVKEYINKNGLNRNSIIIYLCTREVDDNNPPAKVMMKKKRKYSTKTSNSSTLQTIKSESIEYKPVVKIEPDSDSQQIHPSLHEYSFKNASYNLVKNIRDLINPNNCDQILIQVFENCCIMHGLICSTIDPLQQNQYFQSINQSGYLNNLNTIYDLGHSIELLLNLHKDKLNQIQQFSIINNLFLQFYQNLKILRDQWLEHIENNRSDGNSTSFIHPTSSHFNIVSTQNQRTIRK